MTEELKDRWTFLFDQIKEATSRSRLVLAQLNLVCGFILLSLTSSHFSWLKNVDQEEYGLLNKSIYNIQTNYTDFKEFEKNVFNNLDIVSAPVIGIKITVYDFSFLGSIATLILLTWLSFSTRRERHIVSIIKKEFDDLFKIKAANQKDLLKNIYLKTSQVFIFITPSENDVFNKRNNKPNKSHAARSLRYVIIYYLPFITLLAILLFDSFSLRLYKDLSFLIQHRSIELAIRLIVELITIVITWLIIKEIKTNEEATLIDLKEMEYNSK